MLEEWVLHCFPTWLWGRLSVTGVVQLLVCVELLRRHRVSGPVSLKQELHGLGYQAHEHDVLKPRRHLQRGGPEVIKGSSTLPTSECSAVATWRCEDGQVA